MVLNGKRVILLIGFLILPLGLGCEGGRKSEVERCDYDGVKIEPIYAVYFILKDGTEKKFCSMVCASLSYPELKEKVKEVIVVDEISGKKIEASQALFVESTVVTIPHNRNRIHVFGNREDAMKHLNSFKGKWVENPFR